MFDFSGGKFARHKDDETFVRLWPNPVALRRKEGEDWQEDRNVWIDLNVSRLQDMHNRIHSECVGQSHDVLRSLEQGQEFFPWHEHSPQVKYWIALGKRIKALQEIIQVIPQRIVKAVENYPAHQYTLLRFVSRFPEALDLLETSPLLGYLLATHSHGRFGEKMEEFDAVARLLGLPRRQILTALGFSGATESMVQTVSRVVHGACSEECIGMLPGILSNAATARRICFIKRINTGVITLLHHPDLARRVSNRFLEEISESKIENVHADAAKFLMRHADDLKKTDGALPRVFNSQAKLMNWVVDHAADEPGEPHAFLQIAFRHPPVPETEGIVAIGDSQALIDEGEQQGNCVASMVGPCLSGRLFFYRVLWPERATLAIEPHDGYWRIHHIEAAANEPAEQSCIDFVTTWLSKEQGVCVENYVAPESNILQAPYEYGPEDELAHPC